MMEFALIENVQRRDLNPMELAHAYNALVEQHGLSQEEVAQRVGKSRSAITNFIRMLNIPGYLQQSVRNGEVTAGHARALLSIEDEEMQEQVWEQIIDENLSVRDVEKIAQNILRGDTAELPRDTTSSGPSGRSQATPVKSPYIREIEERLQHQFGTKVNVRMKKEGGSIDIQFFSEEELERLLELFENLGM